MDTRYVTWWRDINLFNIVQGLVTLPYEVDGKQTLHDESHGQVCNIIQKVHSYRCESVQGTKLQIKISIDWMKIIIVYILPLTTMVFFHYCFPIRLFIYMWTIIISISGVTGLQVCVCVIVSMCVGGCVTLLVCVCDFQCEYVCWVWLGWQIYHVLCLGV